MVVDPAKKILNITISLSNIKRFTLFGVSRIRVTKKGKLKLRDFDSTRLTYPDWKSYTVEEN